MGFGMTFRRIFIGCMVLVLFGRGVHCLCLDACLCARAAEAARGESPLSDPSESDPNDSRCLCKGALVRAACPLERVKVVRAIASATELAQVSSAWAPAWRFEPAVVDHSWPPPRWGKLARAFLASWQI